MSSADDSQRYVEFFKASLVFFNSRDDLVELWKAQADNRQMVGVSHAQEDEMIAACIQRRDALEEAPIPDNVIPIRPARR